MLTGEYAEYLGRYSERFGLRRYIKFGAVVTSVTQHPQGGWVVRSVEGGGLQREERYDAVAICSGLNQHAYLPAYPGQDSFPGQLMHSSQYRRSEQVRGKRVLVVGGGESGGDIAAEVSQYARETLLSLRRGVAVLPRHRRGQPNDYRTCRLNNSAAHWVFQTRNPADRWKRRTYLAAFLPFVVVDKCLQLVSTLAYEWLPLFPVRRLLDGGASLAEVRTEVRIRRLVRQLLLESGGTVAEQFGTKGDDFVRALVLGRCRRVGSIVRFDGGRVVFDDSSSFEPDVVLFCTGFEPRVGFVDAALARTPRFLHLFNPSIGPSLAFVGFVRPAYGAIPPLAELQARYFALIQSARLSLPPEAEMWRTVDRLVGFRGHFFRAVRGRLDHLIDYTSFCDELASRIGCKPTAAAIRRESLEFRWRFFAAPFVAAQYRLVGPHAKPAIARQVITNLPISHPLPMLTAYYLRWTLSRILYRVLGPEFAPKLMLEAT
jgi:dimethylaniline monooxygenase (N-oxide forming)